MTTTHKPQGQGASLRDRAGRPSARALLRGLGYSATIACAACKIDGHAPSQAAKEADLTCYWSAQDIAKEPDVKAALSDGLLTADECKTVVMPYVERHNADALIRARDEAVRASRQP